ncbi:PIG-L deacetylase family protein [Dokdonella sp.]|uniref:PIG-L deacetylase family protein n=1 Tax=Dokdonella sp. TaxID=2291710 RepID=UPI0035278DCC
MIRHMDIDERDRLLILLPHPDDETLATGGLIQHALAAQAALCVVIATDGDNNPWPQRWIEKCWSIDAAARARWGARRREEARSALSILGVEDSAVHHLGWPDQGLTDLLMRDALAEDQLVRLTDDFSPSMIVAPAICDRHPDHNALGMMLELVLARQDRTGCRRFSYVVHGETRPEESVPLRMTSQEQQTKQRALQAHHTQLSLSRRRMCRLAQRAERYRPLSGGVADVAGWRHAWTLPRVFRSAGTHALELLLILCFSDRVVRARLPIETQDGETRVDIGRGAEQPLVVKLRKAGRCLDLELPDDALIERGFAKLERAGHRLVVYDREGWIEMDRARWPPGRGRMPADREPGVQME